MEWVRLDREDKVRFFVRSGHGIYFSISDGREVLLTDEVPDGPFILRTQMYGNTAGFFVQKDGVTRYLGHIKVEDAFPAELDFRAVSVAMHSTFNVCSNLQGTAVINGASC